MFVCVCEGVRASMHQTSHYTIIIVKAKGQFVSMGCMDQTQIYRLVRKMMFLAESFSCPLFLFAFGFVSLCRCFRQLLLLLRMLFVCYFYCLLTFNSFVYFIYFEISLSLIMDREPSKLPGSALLELRLQKQNSAHNFSLGSNSESYVSGTNTILTVLSP